MVPIRALALYRRLLAPGAAEREWRRRVAHAEAIRTAQLTLRSPDTLLNRAVEYAKVNLDESYVCNPDLGCGLVAGYGLSGGASDRPGFGWFFGGDAAINSFAMTGVGQHALVREGALKFFAKYQRADCWLWFPVMTSRLGIKKPLCSRTRASAWSARPIRDWWCRLPPAVDWLGVMWRSRLAPSCRPRSLVEKH